MEDTFELPINYKGSQLSFKGRLVRYGYAHKIEMDVNGEMVLFEPDEEQYYRACIDPSKVNHLKEADIELVRIIALAIENIRNGK